MMSIEMKEEELRYFESLCNIFYGASSPEEKRKAEEELITITKNPSFANDIELILNCSQSTYAIICMCLSLNHLIIDNWANFSDDRRYEMRNSLLSYLEANGPKLNGLVVKSISTAICLISKLSWNDRRQRQLFDSIEHIIEMDGEYSLLGLSMLTDFVEQMSTPGTCKSLLLLCIKVDNSEYRRVVTQFINDNLLDIFQFAITLLTTIYAREEKYKDPTYEEAVLLGVCRLISKCLQFDFAGSADDDGSDEIWVLQLPYTWEGLVCNCNNLHMLLELYLRVNPPLTLSVLEIIMLYSSVRRSLFRENESRLSFLIVLVEGVQSILEHYHGLNDQDTYNMMCQLLSRLKSNFQLSELMKVPQYSSCFTLIAKFTCDSLKDWVNCKNSVNYLLTLWSRMACADRYVQLNEMMKPNAGVLRSLLPEIVQAYIEGRLAEVIDEDAVNPLDDCEGIQDEMTQFPQMVRFDYDQCGSFIVERLNGMITQYNNAYESMLSVMNSNGDVVSIMTDMKRYENQLALLVHIVANTVSGESFMIVQINSRHNKYDAELCRLVLLLVTSVDAHANAERSYHCDPHLEAAFLAFFLVFRKSFINDHKSFAIIRDAENRGVEGLPPRAIAYRDFFYSIGFEGGVYNAQETIFLKICHNLQSWADNEKIIRMSLELLLELSKGFESSKMLLQMDCVMNVLEHHSTADFPFLLNREYCHYHTVFYEAITNLILLDNVPGRLEVITGGVMEDIEVLFNTPSFSPQHAMMMVFVFRNLRGIVNSCTTKRSFNVVFEIIYPKVFEVMRHAIRELGDDEEVVSSILKFLSSLVLNRERRIDFCNDIANGVTLFKEASTVLMVYSRLLLDHFPSFEQCPNSVYKGLCQLFLVMERFLKGGYIPFGVFKLYNDNCLTDLFSLYMQCIIRTPFKRLSEIPKYEKAVFIFLDLLFADHLETVTSIDSAAFIQIMVSVCKGLTSFSVDVVMASARIMDNVATYLYLNRKKESTILTNIKRIIVAQPNFWDVVMTSLLNAFLYGSSNTLWELSRPILTVYLVSPSSFEAYISNAAQNQTMEVVQQLNHDSAALINNVDYALPAGSRDAFSKKAIVWRRQFISYVKL